MIRAHARFKGKDGDHFRLEVGAREVLAREVVLDTGTRSAVPPIENLHEQDFINSENWLDRPQLPDRLVVVGGGYIGLEMGQFYRRLGSEVTIVQHGAQIAGHEDRDVADALQQLLEDERIGFRIGAKATRVRKLAAGLALTLDTDAGCEELEASDLFVAVGRQPNTDEQGLETIGLAPDDEGIIDVDSRLRTEVAGVWAVGDIRGGAMFTHTSWDDYRIVASQVLGDGSRTLDRVVPYAIFTEPQLGRVGMTEDEARRAGRNIRVGRFDMAGNGKARELGETRGFIKVVVDADSCKLLGTAVLAEDAAELVQLYVILMNVDAPYTVIENAVLIHPTLAEAAQSVFLTL
ncbi:FAD-dependent oxidoreductase [Aromatoleum aromaticum]|uniref:FAD-dependent oxidoreductase n=1 Tax=Aromatoleum aromaticum TaxID=551760 RepID=UPI0002D4CA92|nr:FAD-dependent oxidoreductase [Aromatoleum aromaticum]NMG56103.1 mercuric reductase [Aromatoleum aromaticum]